MHNEKLQSSPSNKIPDKGFIYVTDRTWQGTFFNIYFPYNIYNIENRYFVESKLYKYVYYKFLITI